MFLSLASTTLVINSAVILALSITIYLVAHIIELGSDCVDLKRPYLIIVSASPDHPGKTVEKEYLQKEVPHHHKDQPYLRPLTHKLATAMQYMEDDKKVAKIIIPNAVKPQSTCL